MKVDDAREVTLTIERADETWWNVRVSDRRGGEFAMSSASSLRVALRGALAYIECATEDDSLDMLVRPAGGSG